MDTDIFEQFPDRETFDKYWNENYQPVTYEDVREAFTDYDKNPELYETAFALYEESKLTGKGDASVAQTFHETFRALYAEFLDRLYDEVLAAWQH